MNYDLLAIDLDGTLLRNDHSPHPENVKALKRAADAGLDMILCTGRGWRESRDAIAVLPVDSPIINLSGAVVCEAVTGNTLHSWPIDEHVVRDATRLIYDHGFSPILFADYGFTGYEYLVICRERLVQSTKHWFSLSRPVIRYVDEWRDDVFDHILRIGLVHEKDQVALVYDEYKAAWGDILEIHHFSFGDYLMEAFAKGVSKWKALNWYMDQRGYTAARVAAIGDQVNDVSMITHAGLGIAMQNAVPEIKAVANKHTLSNEDAGVAHAIDQIISGAW